MRRLLFALMCLCASQPAMAQLRRPSCEALVGFVYSGRAGVVEQSFGKAFDGTHDLVCFACAGEVRQVLIFGTVRTTTDCVASWAGATGLRSVAPSADTSTATLSLLRWSRRCPCNRPTIFSISVIGITMRHAGCSSTWPFPRRTDVNRSNLATLSVTKIGPSFSANISIMGFAA